MARRRDYDTPWKEALAFYLPSFFEFFFPAIGQEIDWQRGFKFLDKELRQLERGSAAGSREADTLVEVYSSTGKITWALLHIEVQSQVDSGPNKLNTTQSLADWLNIDLSADFMKADWTKKRSNPSFAWWTGS